MSNDTRKGTRKGHIINVEIVTRYDDSPDTSYIGTYTDVAEEGAIVWATGEFCEDANEIPAPSREYRFFVPYARGEKVQSQSYRAYAQQDWERMRRLSAGEWCYVGIMAQAEITLANSNVIQRITSGGVWGIESDTDGAYLEELASAELEELRGELESLGLGKRAIAAAFKNATHINK